MPESGGPTSKGRVVLAGVAGFLLGAIGFGIVGWLYTQLGVALNPYYGGLEYIYVFMGSVVGGALAGAIGGAVAGARGMKTGKLILGILGGLLCGGLGIMKPLVIRDSAGEPSMLFEIAGVAAAGILGVIAGRTLGRMCGSIAHKPSAPTATPPGTPPGTP